MGLLRPAATEGKAVFDVTGPMHTLFSHAESYYTVRFERREGTFLSVLGVATSHRKDASLVAALTPQELELSRQYRGLRYEEFVHSRYLTKRAVQNLVRDVAMQDIQVAKGVFEQPVLEILTKHSQYDVSISHKGRITGTLVFPKSHPAGIDIESMAHANSGVFTRILTGHEQQLGDGDNASQLVLFTAKEALSKILKCGFTVPLHFLEVKELAYTPDFYSGTFTNFGQYRFVSFSTNQHVLTLVFPRNSKCTLEMIPR